MTTNEILFSLAEDTPAESLPRKALFWLLWVLIAIAAAVDAAVFVNGLSN